MSQIKKCFVDATLGMGVLTLAACSTDVESVTRMPEAEGAAEAQLALALGKSVSVSSRMSDAVVQEGQPFRGIENIHILPFSVDNITASTALSGEYLEPYLLLCPGNTPVGNTLPSMTGKNTALYNKMYVPSGTRRLLFYGVATSNAISNGNAYLHEVGCLRESGFASFDGLDKVEFSLQSIYTDDTGQPHVKGKALAGLLTDVVNTTVTINADVVAWKNYTQVSEIQELWTQITKNIAGSSNSVRALLQDLYVNLNTNFSGDEMAKAIMEKIETYAEVKDGGQTLHLLSDYQNYPDVIGLPDGVACMEWEDSSEGSGSGEFVSYFDPKTDGTNFPYDIPSLAAYAYPPSLYYFVNTDIKVSNEEMQTYYTDDNSWDDILSRYDDGTSVTSSAKSLAMVQPVQYAVGRLDVGVKCNAAQLSAYDASLVDVPAAGFPLTGMFFSKQKNLDWQFLPKNNASEYVVFDNQFTNISVTTTAPAVYTHTLAVETDAGQEVTVAIELENNTGRAFLGFNGQMVYAGSRFYLVGTLQPGTGEKVIEQDHLTKANLVITSLRNAYNVIPDLRAPHLEMGITQVSDWNSAGSGTLPLE